MKPKNYYLELRSKYLPISIGAIFVLESPPISGLYFYDEAGKISEPLFMEMMKFLGINAISKRDGLIKFQNAGYLLVDATYNPVNHLQGKKRNDLIFNDFSLLLEDLNVLNTDKKIPLILIKANICRLLEKPLIESGYEVQNKGVVVPFPSTGQQKKFREQMKLLW
jgi:hypothetical protein